jgi:hypothetical protein
MAAVWYIFYRRFWLSNVSEIKWPVRPNKPPLEVVDFYWWFSLKPASRNNLKSFFLIFLNNVVLKLCSFQPFHLESFGISKLHVNLINFKIQILQTVSDEKSTKIKLVELVVAKFFVWIRLQPQTTNLYSICSNMWAKKDTS